MPFLHPNKNSNGFDINMANIQGDTCLHIAANQEQYEIVNLLLDEKSNLKLKNTSGVTAYEIIEQKSKSLKRKHDALRSKLDILQKQLFDARYKIKDSWAKLDTAIKNEMEKTFPKNGIDAWFNKDMTLNPESLQQVYEYDLLFSRIITINDSVIVDMKEHIQCWKMIYQEWLVAKKEMHKHVAHYLMVQNVETRMKQLAEQQLEKEGNLSESISNIFRKHTIF